MRILLCNPASGLFFQAPDRWTECADQAEDFGSGPRAILFARDRSLHGVEVFWDFGDPEYNVRLPIQFENGTQQLKEAA